MKVTLIRQTERPLELIQSIAPICYGKEESKNPVGLVENLIQLEHFSVFEHVSFTWKIEGISRTCLAQLTRHRHASFTVRSQRYCNESKQEFIIPPSLKENYDTTDYFKIIKREYDRLLSKGVSREDARFILPQAISTDLYMTCNLRELLHIYKLRSGQSAQWEIRDLVSELVNMIDYDLHFMFKSGE